METEHPQTKVETIYQLRDAVEAKVHAEAELDKDATPAARDALLAAQLELEAKTQDVIDVCHECGHSSSDGHAHTNGRVSARMNNVVQVDFRPEAGSA